MLFILLCILSICSTEKFPDDFVFGAASSAYQIEGGWNEDGKGENIWDRLTNDHIIPIADDATGDIACDSYHQIDRDIAMLKRLGAQIYRFSISWSRVLPYGFSNVTNIAGLEYYNRLINGLLDAGIEPFITIFHLDLPLTLQEQGGWLNPDCIKWFTDYADLILSKFADRVKYWITYNEAVINCDYLTPISSNDPEEILKAAFQCTKHHLLAHASVYKLYHEKYRCSNGIMSLSNIFPWFDSLPSDKITIFGSEDMQQFTSGRFSYPIFSKAGGWPPHLIRYMDEYSRRQGYNTSLLPALTEEEIEFIRGTADFIGVNHYNTLWTQDSQVSAFLQNPRAAEQFNWLAVDNYVVNDFPPGLRDVLNWIRNNYGDWDIFITENGYSDESRSLDDFKRIECINNILNELLVSMNEDGHKIIGYTYWSLMDNFEWSSGYRIKFGLFDVDFTDPNRTTTMRSSGDYYACVIRERDSDYCISLALKKI